MTRNCRAARGHLILVATRSEGNKLQKQNKKSAKKRRAHATERRVLDLGRPPASLPTGGLNPRAVCELPSFAFTMPNSPIVVDATKREQVAARIARKKSNSSWIRKKEALRRKSANRLLEAQAAAAATSAAAAPVGSTGAGGTPVITVGELFMNLHTHRCPEKFDKLHKSPTIQWVVSLYFEYPQYRSYAAIKQEIVKRVGFKGFRDCKGHIQEILFLFNDEMRRSRPPLSLMDLQMIADGVLGQSSADLELKHDTLAENKPAEFAKNTFEAVVARNSTMTPSQARDTYRKTIFVIRHGKSVWNKAQEEKDLVKLIGRDHGLCSAGVDQAEVLNEHVQKVVQRQRLRVRAESGTVSTPQEELEHHFFCAGQIFVSPLTRAIQTALIGLQNHPCAKRRGIKLMRQIREVKHTVGGLDTLGVAKGEEIRARALAKLDELYLGEFFKVDNFGNVLGYPTNDPKAIVAYEKVKRFASTAIDHSDVTDQWWTVMTDTRAALDARVASLLEEIRNSPYESVILVGHSLFFKHLMGEYQHPAFRAEDPLYASIFQNSKLENCGMAALELDFSVQDINHVVRNITMMFGSKTIASKSRQVQDDVSQMQTEKYGVEWQKDYECTACVVCDAKFTFTRRRHHCRFCGRIICSRCSRYNLDNVKTKQSERACDLCVEASNKTPSLARPMPLDLDRKSTKSKRNSTPRSPGSLSAASSRTSSIDDGDEEIEVVDPELLRHRNDPKPMGNVPPEPAFVGDVPASRGGGAVRIPKSTTVDII